MARDKDKNKSNDQENEATATQPEGEPYPPMELPPGPEATTPAKKSRKPRTPKAPAAPQLTTEELNEYATFVKDKLAKQRLDESVPMETLTATLETYRKLDAMTKAGA